MLAALFAWTDQAGNQASDVGGYQTGPLLTLRAVEPWLTFFVPAAFWHGLSQIAFLSSVGALTPHPIALTGPRNDMIAVGGGLALYVAFVVLLHRVLIGVSPMG